MQGWLTWLIVGAIAGVLADLAIKGIKLGLIGKILYLSLHYPPISILHLYKKQLVYQKIPPMIAR